MRKTPYLQRIQEHIGELGELFGELARINREQQDKIQDLQKKNAELKRKLKDAKEGKKLQVIVRDGLDKKVRENILQRVMEKLRRDDDYDGFTNFKKK